MDREAIYLVVEVFLVAALLSLSIYLVDRIGDLIGVSGCRVEDIEIYSRYGLRVVRRAVIC